MEKLAHAPTATKYVAPATVAFRTWPPIPREVVCLSGEVNCAVARAYVDDTGESIVVTIDSDSGSVQAATFILKEVAKDIFDWFLLRGQLYVWSDTTCLILSTITRKSRKYIMPRNAPLYVGQVHCTSSNCVLAYEEIASQQFQYDQNVLQLCTLSMYGSIQSTVSCALRHGNTLLHLDNIRSS